MHRRVSRVSRRLFLSAAGLSFVGSVLSWFLIDREVGLFIGLWVPSILSLAIFLQLHFREGRP